MAAHPYATIEDAVAVLEREARPVPSPHPTVCPYCFGPKGPDFSQCYGCKQLRGSGAGWELLRRVVPVSIAPSPGPWYSRMLRYKGASPDDIYVVAAAAYVAFTVWAEAMTAALGGPADAICIVPSTRNIDLHSQRLGRALELVSPYLPPIAPLLHHRPGEEKPRNAINHRLFIAENDAVSGKRIVLVEDTWVTGSGAMAAACALEAAQAASILVMPIARRVETQSVANVLGPEYNARLETMQWSGISLAWPR